MNNSTRSRLCTQEAATLSLRPVAAHRKISVRHGETAEVKTILEALDEALFDAVLAAIDKCLLWEYLETGSLGRVSELCICMYDE